jgi:hypothetical protein
LARNGVTTPPLSGASVFHSPQSAHWPDHLLETEPQALHAYRDSDLAMIP